MSTAVQVEIVIPESMGKVEALAKVSTSLQGVIARKRREWRASRGEIAVLGPNVEVRPACRLFVYRVARDFGGDSMRFIPRTAESGEPATGLRGIYVDTPPTALHKRSAPSSPMASTSSSWLTHSSPITTSRYSSTVTT